MFTKVLVGVDGEQGGRDAIALAEQLGDPEACMTLAHICGAGLMPGRGAAVLLAAELEESAQLLQRERVAAPPGAESITCTDHSIGRALHSLATEQGFDLIVIGASRRGFAGRVLLGNDAIATLDGAPCPVAIAPPGYAEHAHHLTTLGLGYDGSPQSERALATALELRALSGSTIKVLTVVPLQSRPYGEELPAKWPEAAVLLSDDQVLRLRNLENVEGEVAFGKPSEALASFAEEVDLLIVGCRGYGPMKRMLHSGVSRHLAGHTACPMLVLQSAAIEPVAADTAERAQATPA